MATYWVDHEGSETDPYDTQAKAAQSLATILAIPPAAGDIIYCCDNAGTGETIAAELDFSSGGSNAVGWIRIIGCNSSGVVDGTRYVIDGGANGINIFDMNDYDLLWFENIEVTNTGGSAKHGWYTSSGTAIGNVYINCAAHACSGDGWYASTNQSLWFRCVSYSNTTNGWNSATSGVYICCCAHDNGGNGWTSNTSGQVWIGCIAQGNTGAGIGSLYYVSTIFNCVIDGNANGITEVAAGHTSLLSPWVIGNRITNHTGGIGINCNSEPFVTGYNYLENNLGDNIQNTTVHRFIPIIGGSTTSNKEDQSDTNYGYVNPGSDDYTTNYVSASDPTLRREAITVPWT